MTPPSSGASGGEFRISTPSGEVSARFHEPRRADALVVLAHGAGAGMDHPFMTGFFDALTGLGVAALAFNFPYIEAGRRSPDQAPRLLSAMRAAFEAGIERARGRPVWAAGKSLGGRIASMAAADGMPVAGLVFIGYPLHPPGREDRIRDAHLDAVPVPMLFLQGTADPFARLELLREVVERLGSRATLHEVEGADHSFRVRGDGAGPSDRAAALSPVAVEFIRAEAGRAGGR